MDEWDAIGVADAPLHPLDQRILEENRKSLSLGRDSPNALQLRSNPQDSENHARDGRRGFRARLVSGRNRDGGGLTYVHGLLKRLGAI